MLGPSGAGKSTLFRVLVGDSPGEAGTVRSAAQDVTGWPLWRRARAGIGYVPQGPSVLWDLTVRANLVAYRRIARLPEADRGDRGREAWGSIDRLDVRAGELSGGERRRLELARALTRTARASSSATSRSPGSIRREPSTSAAAGRPRRRPAPPVMLADHHVEEALRVCTRALLLLDGAVAVDAPAAGFRDHPLVRGRYLGTLQVPAPPGPLSGSEGK